MRRAAILLLVSACAATPRPSPMPTPNPTPTPTPIPTRTPTPTPTTDLHAIFEAEWETWMRESPAWASRMGDRRYNDQWGDPSLEAIARRHAHDEEVLAKLRAFPKETLPAPERLNYDLFVHLYEEAIEAHALKLYLLPLDHMSGVQTADELADQLRFTTLKDYEDWNARIAAYGQYVDRTIGVLREGIRAKVVHPRVIMDRIPAQLRAHEVTVPTKSTFYKPFTKFPDAIAQADRERLQKTARDRIADTVVPAYKRLEAFFTAEYLPACPATVGAWPLPRGDEAYAYLARRHTTTTLAPREIHEIGLAEVARIRAEMERVKEKAGFKGPLKDFFTFLRKDPRFYYKSPDELFRAYAVTAKRIDPMLVRVFRTLPRMPYGVEPIAEQIAPDTTTAFYREGAEDGSRAGAYMVNLYKPETRPSWEMMALTMHEAVPGHHLQIALAMEQRDLPKFRQHADVTAYIEGWALYAESLGDEMGLYDDPYAKFGQLAYEMWRAVRLVVDTGMHALKWDRKRAIQYFMDNSPRQELDITNEIDRYIAWPGQALAYKIGELKIKELRARATKQLGAKFDVRAFHDVVLAQGALPLSVLERNVDAWISEH